MNQLEEWIDPAAYWEAEYKRLKADLEIVRKASRLFEEASNAWMERALKAEAELNLSDKL